MTVSHGFPFPFAMNGHPQDIGTPARPDDLPCTKSMPKKFFTSDHHFGHANILKYEARNRVNAFGRTFQDVHKMDEYLIDRWNASINADDEVYVLGDFSFKRAFMIEYLPYLNGRKFLIAGNHDPYFKGLVSGDTSRRTQAIADAKADGWDEVWIRHQIEIEGVGQVMLSHLPYQPQTSLADLLPYEARYYDLQPVCDGSVDLLLHGHVHGKWMINRQPGKSRNGHCRDHLMINVGVDVWSMGPVAEHELIDLFRQHA